MKAGSMKRDLKVWIILLAFGLPVLAIAFIGSIFLYNCGLDGDCARGNLAGVIHTPIPTLFPATLPPPKTAQIVSPDADSGGVPRPSNPGEPGAAVNLPGDAFSGQVIFGSNCASCHGEAGVGGIPNPGSTDGTVPALNPIDPLMKDLDLQVFAANIDLFIQHGSIPRGPGPLRTMPAWGDRNALTQQHIADLIAYIISLNK